MTNLGLPEAELSILFVNDQQIRGMNRKYLGLDKPTNVLSFSMREGVNSSLNPHLLGDLVISIETAKRQSKAWGLSPMKMITLLMIHGILHLIGYEHEGDRKEARKMALKQKLLFHQVTQSALSKSQSKMGKKRVSS